MASDRRFGLLCGLCLSLWGCGVGQEGEASSKSNFSEYTLRQLISQPALIRQITEADVERFEASGFVFLDTRAFLAHVPKSGPIAGQSYGQFLAEVASVQPRSSAGFFERRSLSFIDPDQDSLEMLQPGPEQMQAAFGLVVERARRAMAVAKRDGQHYTDAHNFLFVELSLALHSWQVYALEKVTGVNQVPLIVDMMHYGAKTDWPKPDEHTFLRCHFDAYGYSVLTAIEGPTVIAFASPEDEHMVDILRHSPDVDGSGHSRQVLLGSTDAYPRDASEFVRRLGERDGKEAGWTLVMRGEGQTSIDSSRIGVDASLRRFNAGLFGDSADCGGSVQVTQAVPHYVPPYEGTRTVFGLGS